MRRNRLTSWSILLSFSLLAGQFAWRLFGPAEVPAYFVQSELGMTGSNPASRHLYLRYKFYLSERPQHAWLQTIARGRIRVYVNGRLLAERSPDGTLGATLVDPTPLLQQGPNVIAIATEQYSPRRPALVAVDGAYTIAATEHRLGSGTAWRASDLFERQKDWWFMPAFDDQHWSQAALVPGRYQSPIKVPPRALTQPATGHWLTSRELRPAWSCIGRLLNVHGRPRQAWLRVMTASMHRIAVNGVVIDVHEEVMGVSKPSSPSGRIYDITPLMKRGRNLVTIALESNSGPARLNCDLEVQDHAGGVVRLGTDEEWRESLDVPDRWYAPSSLAGWTPCHVEAGYLGVPPWTIVKSVVQGTVPVHVTLARQAAWGGLVLAILLFGVAACSVAGSLLAWATGTDSLRGLAVLALMPSVLLLFLIWLLPLDSRIAWQAVYRAELFYGALILVPVQWLLFGIYPAGRRLWRAGLGSVRRLPVRGLGIRRQSRLITPAMALITLIGFLVRLPGVANRPLGADEVNMYRCVQGFYERGFPSFVVHEDLPPQFISTSELVYAGGIIAELFFDDDRYVIRFPSVVWGTLTIILIYWMGRAMFHPVVGITAAAVYAFAPIPITMANFGRYPSQLQFFTVLTVYCFWRTIGGRGPLDRRYLAFTAISAIAMFLSWEPSLLLGAGMIAAAMWFRRGRMESIVLDRWVYVAVAAVAVTVLVQVTHRNFKQAQRMNIGTGASDVTLKPMWRYAHFDIAHFLKATSWCSWGVLPLAGLLGGLSLTLKHPFRNSALYVAIILLMTSAIIALVLPVDADRYSYFLTPLLMILAAAALVAAGRSVRKLVAGIAPAPYRWFARVIARASVALLAVLAIEPAAATVEWDGTLDSLNPMAQSTRYLGGPADFLTSLVRDGDIVLGTQPYLLDHQMERASAGNRPLPNSTLWLQTRLHLQAVLDDRRPLPLNRRDGTIMVANLESLRTLFAQPRRIWFVVEKGHFNRLNVGEVDRFLREHMEVVYEDSESIVLLRDRRHWPAVVRDRDEQTLRQAQTDYLRKDAATTDWGVTGGVVHLAPSATVNPADDRDYTGTAERNEGL